MRFAFECIFELKKEGKLDELFGSDLEPKTAAEVALMNFKNNTLPEIIRLNALKAQQFVDKTKADAEADATATGDGEGT